MAKDDAFKSPLVEAVADQPNWVGVVDPSNSSTAFCGVAVKLIAKAWSAVSLSLLFMVRVAESGVVVAGVVAIEKVVLLPGAMVTGVVIPRQGPSGAR